MHYVGISTYQFIPYYASATHTRILKPFAGSDTKGLKVDIEELNCYRGYLRKSGNRRGTLRDLGVTLFKQRRWRIATAFNCQVK